MLTVCFRVLLVSFIAVSIFLLVFFWTPLSSAFISFLIAVQGRPDLQIGLILMAALVTAALMFIPCLPITMAAGFLLGTIRGSIVITTASIIAACLAFLIGRYLARGLVEAGMGERNSRWRAIDSAINGDGLRIVFLIRLSPIHPFAVLNYLFGLSSVSMCDYAVASYFGMLPTTVMEVWSGAALGDLSELGQRNPISGPVLIAALVLTLLVTIAVTTLVRRKLQVELSKHYAPVSEEEEEEETDIEDARQVELGGIDVTSDDDSDEGSGRVMLDSPASIGSAQHSYALQPQHEAPQQTGKLEQDEEKTLRDGEQRRRRSDTPTNADMEEVEMSAVLQQHGPPSQLLQPSSHSRSPAASPPGPSAITALSSSSRSRVQSIHQASPAASPVRLPPPPFAAPSPLSLRSNGIVSAAHEPPLSSSPPPSSSPRSTPSPPPSSLQLSGPALHRIGSSASNISSDGGRGDDGDSEQQLISQHR